MANVISINSSHNIPDLWLSNQWHSRCCVGWLRMSLTRILAWRCFCAIGCFWDFVFSLWIKLDFVSRIFIAKRKKTLQMRFDSEALSFIDLTRYTRQLYLLKYLCEFIKSSENLWYAEDRLCFMMLYVFVLHFRCLPCNLHTLKYVLYGPIHNTGTSINGGGDVM
jgi:hypothetical protein